MNFFSLFFKLACSNLTTSLLSLRIVSLITFNLFGDCCLLSSTNWGLFTTNWDQDLSPSGIFSLIEVQSHLDWVNEISNHTYCIGNGDNDFYKNQFIKSWSHLNYHFSKPALSNIFGSSAKVEALDSLYKSL